MRLALVVASVVVFVVLIFAFFSAFDRFVVPKNKPFSANFFSAVVDAVHDKGTPERDSRDHESGLFKGLVDGDEDYFLVLDELAANGFKSTQQMVDEIHSRYAISHNPAEKIKLAHLFNTAYFGTDDLILKQRISKILGRLLQEENDPEAGRALALSHSRLTYNEDTQNNLQFAYKKKFLLYNDYFGELAHILSGAPVREREEIGKEIAQSGSRYAVQIISNDFANLDLKGLSSSELKTFFDYLLSNEPIFSGAPGSFGLMDAIQYDNWLRSLAHISKQTSGRDVGGSIFDKVLDGRTDPRASVAALLSPATEEILRKTNSARAFAVQRRALEYIEKNPSSASLQDVGKYISKLTF